MQYILTDLSSSALANAVQANLFEFLALLRYGSETEFLEEPGFRRWQTATPHPWFNGVLVSRPPAPDDARLVEDTVQYFRARSVPS